MMEEGGIMTVEEELEKVQRIKAHWCHTEEEIGQKSYRMFGTLEKNRIIFPSFQQHSCVGQRHSNMGHSLRLLVWS